MIVRENRSKEYKRKKGINCLKEGVGEMVGIEIYDGEGEVVSGCFNFQINFRKNIIFVETHR